MIEKDNTIIPSILGNDLIPSNFAKKKKKKKIFHDFYSRQCQTISNIDILQLTLLFETANHLSIADSKTDTIIKVIQILNQNKAHEQDDISFKLLKLLNHCICHLIIVLEGEFSLTSGKW